MKRVRCPRCEGFVTFDDNQYTEGQSLVFTCQNCGKQFGIRIGVSKLRNIPKEESCNEDTLNDYKYGYIVVIENVFHYKQIIPLCLGDNIIGRYMKGNNINCPIETNDPSMDTNHCKINVSQSKLGIIRYTLKDGPSNTGTFVENEILGDREYRVIEDGTLFTIGATSIILHSSNQK